MKRIKVAESTEQYNKMINPEGQGVIKPMNATSKFITFDFDLLSPYSKTYKIETTVGFQEQKYIYLPVCCKVTIKNGWFQNVTIVDYTNHIFPSHMKSVTNIKSFIVTPGLYAFAGINYLYDKGSKVLIELTPTYKASLDYHIFSSGKIFKFPKSKSAFKKLVDTSMWKTDSSVTSASKLHGYVKRNDTMYPIYLYLLIVDFTDCIIYEYTPEYLKMAYNNDHDIRLLECAYNAYNTSSFSKKTYAELGLDDILS